MKRLLSVSLVILLIGGIAFAAQPGYRKGPGVGEIFGQGKQQSDPHKIFRMVRYVPAGGTANSTTLTAESIVIWDLVSDDGVTVTTTTTSYDSAVAGIIAQSALTPTTLSQTAVQDKGDRCWTWLQTYGYAKARVSAAGDVAAGESMACSETAGEAADYIGSTSAGAVYGIAGFWYDASAKALDGVECFIMTN